MAYSFSYNGITAEDMGIYKVTAIENNIFPAIEARTLSIPGRDGDYFAGKRYGIREIGIEFLLKGDLINKIRAISGWLAPGDSPKQLVLLEEPDKYYNAVVKDRISVDRIGDLARCEVLFVCYDPFAYSVDEKKQTITVIPPTFSRGSLAYKSDGTQVAAGQPRFELGKFGQAIMIEEGTTNLLLYSQDFTQSVWDKRYVDVSSAGTYLGYPVTRFTPNTPGQFSWVAQTFLASGAANRTFTWSFWARGQTNRQFRVNFYGGVSGTFVSYTINLTTEWQKFTITHTFPSNATSARIQWGNVIPYWGIEYTDWIEVAGVQVEEKPYGTSYIKTTSATATRSPETLTIPTAGVLNPQEGTIEVWVKPLIVTNYNNFFYMTTSNGRFLLFFYSDGRARFDYGPNNSGPITPANTILPNQWHYIVLRWSASTNKQALFINGVKYEQNLPNGVATSFPSTVSIVNNFSAFVDDLRISSRARTDEEILAQFQSGTPAEVDPDTTLLLRFDGNLNPEDNNIISPSGTYSILPEIDIYFGQVTSFGAVMTSDRAVILGYPNTVEGSLFDEVETMLNDSLSSLTGWGTAGSVDGGLVTGAFATDGVDFIVSDYGTGAAWHGPAVKKSIAQTIADFRITFDIELKNTTGKVGRAELYLLDSNGAAIGKVALVDRSSSIDDVSFEARAGDRSSGYYFANTNISPGKLNNFSGQIVLERKGNNWKAKLITGETSWIWTFVDEQGVYGASLAQVQLHAGVYGGNTPAEIKLKNLKVEKLNTPGDLQFPKLFFPGDMVQVDCSRGVVYKNGVVDMSILDLSSRMLKLKPGQENIVKFYPANTATVVVKFRERWL